MTDVHAPSTVTLGRRRPVQVSSATIIHQRFGDEARQCPLIVEPAIEGVNLTRWAAGERQTIDGWLTTYGAVLFRGFPQVGLDAYHEFSRLFTDSLLDYVERVAPRRTVAKGIYTSTEFPADQWILQHHELAYAHRWPQLLWFYCARAAETGGGTPIARAGEVWRRIPDTLKDQFTRTGVQYVRNYGHGVDLDWEEAFQTNDRREVERYGANAGMEIEWLGGNRLRTRQRRPAVKHHPVTGEPIWFNSAHVFHITNVELETRQALLAQLAQEDLPRNVLFGDGSIIPDEHLDTIRRIYADCSICVPWQAGDILMLDNLLVTHGRQPFTGARQVLVSMARPASDQDGHAAA